MTSLFGFLSSLVISVKQKNSSAVGQVPPTWRAHLTIQRTALRLKARGRASLNSTGNELSAACSHVRLQTHSIVLHYQLYFEGLFQAEFG